MRLQRLSPVRTPRAAASEAARATARESSCHQNFLRWPAQQQQKEKQKERQKQRWQQTQRWQQERQRRQQQGRRQQQEWQQQKSASEEACRPLAAHMPY